MAINKITAPNDPPTSDADWTQSLALISALALGIEGPYRVVGSNVVRGAVFNIGGSVYLADSDTAITGTASKYVKITPSGSTASASFASSLTGVSWNSTYNGYYDGSGNLYIFDELLAYATGDITTVYGMRNLNYSTQDRVGVGNDVDTGLGGVNFGMTNDASASSVTLGRQCTTTAEDGTAVGNVNTAAESATAVGYDNLASGLASLAAGFSNEASGNSSSAVGSGNTASGSGSTAIGKINEASDDHATAIGDANLAGLESTAVGYNNIANISATVIGRGNVASAGASSAVGYNNTVSGASSSAIGNNNTASGLASFASGYGNNASGSASAAMGRNNIASGNYSFAAGFCQTCDTDYETAINKIRYVEFPAGTTQAVAFAKLYSLLGNNSTQRLLNVTGSCGIGGGVTFIEVVSSTAINIIYYLRGSSTYESQTLTITSGSSTTLPSTLRLMFVSGVEA